MDMTHQHKTTIEYLDYWCTVLDNSPDAVSQRKAREAILKYAIRLLALTLGDK